MGVANTAVLRRVGFAARRLEEADVWSARPALLRGMGEGDAVPPGHYNLPVAVSYSLAGEERGDGRRMLELLEPYRGQQGRLLRWIHAAGRWLSRRAPRRPLRLLPPEGLALARALAR